MPAARNTNDSRKGLLHNATARCAVIGFLSGLISSVSLITTLHSLWLGISLGVLFGALYALAGKRVPFAYAESVFTAAALVIPLWATFSLILLPIFAGAGPQWSAEGIRMLFPQFVGWLLYGASLGLIVQALRDVSSMVLAPEAVGATVPFSATRVVILGGGFAGMATAQYLEREFGPDRSVSITLVSETNALLFTPMLAEVAGSSVEPSHISSPLRTSLHRTDFVRARVPPVLEKTLLRSL
jgi:NADH:ubiquinone reductase (H+-translocating)